MRAAAIAAAVAAVGAAIAGSGLAGCAARDAPYRFRSPMIGGVRAVTPAIAGSSDADDLDTGVDPVRVEPGTPPPESFPAHATTQINKPELEPGESPSLPDVLRGLVGHRDKDSTHLEFAFQAAAAVGAELSPEVRSLESGPALVSLARERSAIGAPSEALVGDLVVFDRVEGGRRASLVGVVAGRRADGTIEFVYLARGVVRRGWVNTESPAQKRGDDGRVLNTFVRHNNGGNPRGTRYLAGELFAAVIRLDSL